MQSSPRTQCLSKILDPSASTTSSYCSCAGMCAVRTASCAALHTRQYICAVGDASSFVTLQIGRRSEWLCLLAAGARVVGRCIWYGAVAWPHMAIGSAEGWVVTQVRCNRHALCGSAVLCAASSSKCIHQATDRKCWTTR